MSEEKSIAYRVEPAGNQIAVELIEEEEKTTKGGIILPDQVKDAPQLAVVIEVGPGTRSIHGEFCPVPYKKGDILIIKRYSPVKVELPNKSYMMFISEFDVMGRLVEVDLETGEEAAKV